jgi:DNA polymerase-3 subunit alpha/error-prone DNA polymerase
LSWYYEHPALELDLYFERFKPESQSPPDFDIDWSWKNGIPFSNTFLIDTVEIMWLLWYQCRIQIPLDIPKVGRVLVCKEELMLAKNPMQLHDTNSVVALVQKYILENIPINAACIPAELISEEPITNYTVLEMPPRLSHCFV